MNIRGVNASGALFFILPVLVIVYLLSNTGLVSDDFVLISHLKDRPIMRSVLTDDPRWLALPVDHYAILIWYHFFRIGSIYVLEILKIFYALVSLFMVSKFFGKYMSREKALVAAFLFIFFPSHDSTAYWFLAYYLTLSAALYLFAYYLADTGRLWMGAISAAAGSFISYGSPILAVPIALLAFLNRKYKEALMLVIPNIAFIIYYVSISRIIKDGPNRIPAAIDVSAVFKQILVQIVTFVDSVMGPSMWLKVYYAIRQLSPISVMVGIGLCVIIVKAVSIKREKSDTKVIICMILMTFMGFFAFALTGKYPQLAFNLGNRTTIFGSLLVVYIIMTAPLGRTARLVIMCLMVFAILGISDHWKSWTAHQDAIISRIKGNADLREYSDSKAVYVSGNQYSKYGRLGHIEFFSEGSAVGPVFSLALNKEILTEPLNSRYKYSDGRLVDTKHGTSTKVDAFINVYDSENDIFFTVQADQINRYIESLPRDDRHWIQLINVKWLRSLVTLLAPKLSYLFLGRLTL